jgi:palmitoyltransferase
MSFFFYCFYLALIAQIDNQIMFPSPSNKYFRPVIPTFVILYMAFAQWAYSYLFCYNHVYKNFNDKASMIAFLVIANILWLITLISWILVSYIGPGKLPFQIPPYELSKYVYNGRKFSEKNEAANDTFSTMSSYSTLNNNDFLNPPDIFECDKNGLPFWCSECSSLKLFRSHHSSVNKICIPLFDHFCSFIGFTIGKKNFIPFFIFVFSIEILLIFAWISVIVYAAVWKSLHAALIVFVILSGILSLMVLNLISNLIIDLYRGETTIERMNRERWHKLDKKGKASTDEYYYESYINIKHPMDENLRLIVPLLPTDKLYDNGIKNNIKLWFYNLKNLKNPQELSDFCGTMYGDKFKNNIKQRIESGDFHIFGTNPDLNSVFI